MLITIKNLQQQTFQIEINETETVNINKFKLINPMVVKMGRD